MKRPIGPSPPVSDPVHDPFEWGLGEDADFIVTVPCKPLSQTSSWLYKDWMANFKSGNANPKVFCPHASSRISWNLLNVVHTTQVEQGLHIASESIMPLFALWHGLKLSQPRQPWFLTPLQGNITKKDDVLNGGPASAENSGYSHGTTSYNGRVLDEFNWQNEQNWWWRSGMPDKIMKTWLGIDPVDKNQGAIFSGRSGRQGERSQHGITSFQDEPRRLV